MPGASVRRPAAAKPSLAADARDTAESRRTVAALGALAQETRLQLFRLLVQRGPDGVAAGVLADALGVPPSSLSFHLAQLVHAGLITQRRVSRRQIYAADYDAMNTLMGFLTENCCGGAATCGPAACDPSPHARARRKP